MEHSRTGKLVIYVFNCLRDNIVVGVAAVEQRICLLQQLLHVTPFTLNQNRKCGWKQVRIWAWDNPEHQLKIEVFGLGGAIKDLAWGPESKRIVVCGAGSGVNARAFMWDTGSNLGEVVGHSKRVISCDYRQVRPYRIMTGSEDHRTIFYQGPPFKMDHSNNSQHTNFVNCVRFSPDGSKIATCSSDKKVGVEPYL